MSESSSASSGGIGIISLLTVVFVVLKLTDVIDWSWFWVLSPTIIPLGITFAVLIIIGIWFLIRYIIAKK